jgi:hypothetical protein
MNDKEFSADRNLQEILRAVTRFAPPASVRQEISHAYHEEGPQRVSLHRVLDVVVPLESLNCKLGLDFSIPLQWQNGANWGPG